MGDEELSSKLTVQKDPSSEGSEADIEAQVMAALAIRNDLNTVVDSINRTEWVRKQINDLTDLLEEDDDNESIVTAAEELDKKLADAESAFFQPILAEGDLKSFRAPNRLYSQLALLGGDIANGSADFPPTTQQLEVYEELKSELDQSLARLNGLFNWDIPEFNDLLRGEDLSNIVAPTP